MSNFVKVLAVIRSCKTSRHNSVADAMIGNYADAEYRKIRQDNNIYRALKKINETTKMVNQLLDENDRILIEICENNKGAT